MCVCENQLISIAWHFGHKRFSLNTHSHLSIFTPFNLHRSICMSFIHSSSVMVLRCWMLIWRNTLHSYKCEVMWVRLTKYMNRYLQHMETYGLFIAYISLVQDEEVTYCEIFEMDWKFLGSKWGSGCQRNKCLIF